MYEIDKALSILFMYVNSSFCSSVPFNKFKEQFRIAIPLR
ncbi:MAG: hypothetical protein ACFWTN_11875 [Clostridium sp.]|jgi:hypothetical protein